MNDNDWIDVSLTLKSGMLHWPGDPPVIIERVRDMDRGDTLNLSRITMGVHSGTHVDAPVHFLNGAAGIDRIPFHPLVGEARIIAIAAKESIKEEDFAGHNVEKGGEDSSQDRQFDQANPPSLQRSEEAQGRKRSSARRECDFQDLIRKGNV